MYPYPVRKCADPLEFKGPGARKGGRGRISSSSSPGGLWSFLHIFFSFLIVRMGPSSIERPPSSTPRVIAKCCWLVTRIQEPVRMYVPHPPRLRRYYHISCWRVVHSPTSLRPLWLQISDQNMCAFLSDFPIASQSRRRS